MSDRVTILVNSCDKYEHAWHPFFECLWHFAGALPYPIILNTETKTYCSPHYSVLCINTETSKRLTWSQRLLHVLTSVNTEFVFFLLEDYFLKAPFDRERFESVLTYMHTHPDVCFTDVKPRYAASPEQQMQNRILYADAPDTFLERNHPHYNITCSPGIWRTDALKSLLRPHEDIWDFEVYVGIRAKKANWKVIRFETRSPGLYEYDDQIMGGGMGITAGRWLPANKPFFDSLGIAVNYDRLGIMDASSIEEIRSTIRRNPISMIKKVPMKIRKRINRRKSLQ